MTLSLTDKQRQLIQTFEGLMEQHAIKLYINAFPPAAWPGPEAVDVEHDEAGGMVGICFYNGAYAEYWTVITPDLIRHCLRNEFVLHNGISDFECLRQWGIPVKDEQLVWDTYLMAHIQDSSLKAYGLKDMAKRELGIEYPEYDKIVGKHRGKTKKVPKCPQLRSDCCGRVTLDKQPLELVAMYNSLDTFCTYQLYLKQCKYAG